MYSPVVKCCQVNHSNEENRASQQFQLVNGLNDVDGYQRKQIGWNDNRFPVRSILLSLIAIVP
jgi:hypothetical protein